MIVGWAVTVFIALLVVSLLPMNSLTTDASGSVEASVWETENKVWWIIALVAFLGLGILAGYLAVRRARGYFQWFALTAALIGPAAFLVDSAMQVSRLNSEFDDLLKGYSGLGLDASFGSWSLEIGFWLACGVLLVGGLGGGWAVLRAVARVKDFRNPEAGRP